jgi:uncharacterized protein YabE (DUF348 family)
MNKRLYGPITRMYVTIIALLLLVSMTGFIDRGRTVSIEFDGTTQTVYTHAVNSDALIRECNIPMGPYDECIMTTPKLEDGTQLKVFRAVDVTLDYHGQKQQVQTAKQTVQDVAEQYGYTKEKYRAYGDIKAPVTKGMTIKIGNVSRKTITEDEVVQYAIESIPDDTLGQGEENILQEGQNGRKRVTVDMISIDGQLAGKEIVDSQLINEMQPLIRHVGTKETVEINTGSISKYKAVYTMVATAYLPTDGNGECITKMGTWARRGEIAVDPNVIPLGTVVYIPGYGVATAEDTGGDILGNRIDLCMEDYNECMAFGRRTILVYILD